MHTVPNDLFIVIEHALRVLAWQENLSSEECPPSWMWNLDWEIEEWFKKIKIERENKYGTSNSSSKSNDDTELMFDDENVYFSRLKTEGSLFE